MGRLTSIPTSIYDNLNQWTPCSRV